MHVFGLTPFIISKSMLERRSVPFHSPKSKVGIAGSLRAAHFAAFTGRFARDAGMMPVRTGEMLWSASVNKT